jgi:hypothetical protein
MNTLRITSTAAAIMDMVGATTRVMTVTTATAIATNKLNVHRNFTPPAILGLALSAVARQ